MQGPLPNDSTHITDAKGIAVSGSPPVLPASSPHVRLSQSVSAGASKRRDAIGKGFHREVWQNLKRLLTCHHLAVALHGAPSRGSWQKLGGFELEKL